MSPQNISTLPHKRSRSLALDVMNDISAKIRRGIYRPGEKLPSEPQVMVEQGVSRPVVREAMSRLQAAGFVETRHGVGTFVLPLPPDTTPSLDITTVLTMRDVLAMLELRISVETEAASLAALRRSEEHLVLMRRAIDAFEEGVNKGESSVDADFQFHLQIALATGNKYFEDFYRRLGVTTIPRTRIDTPQYSEESTEVYLHRINREHACILDAIARKDPQTASASIRMHLSNGRERLRLASEAAELRTSQTTTTEFAVTP